MKVDMIMPQMGESIVEGTIVSWRRKAGDIVEKEEIILEISTDKVDSEIPSPVAGRILEIVVKEGETVEVGTVIARLETESKAQVDVTDDIVSKTPALTEQDIQKVDVQERKRENNSKKFLSPVVRKIAQENGLDREQVESIVGTGANGRITKHDILAYLKHGATRKQDYLQEPEKEPLLPENSLTEISHSDSVFDNQEEIIPMDHMRKKIAMHMIKSQQTSAHVTSVSEADLTQIGQYREKIKSTFQQREGVKLTFLSFIVDVVAKALKEYPLLNSSVNGDNIVLKKRVHIGVAVGMEKGLIVPVIKNADQLSFTGIAHAIADLSERARSRKLNPEEVQGGTFSITNLGTFGNLFGTPVINQPQVAILGCGAIKKKPVVINDAIAIRSMAYLSLTFDHRIIDGLYGGSFLQRICQLLENYRDPAIIEA